MNDKPPTLLTNQRSIVDRLRHSAAVNRDGGWDGDAEEREEAADEIERLMRELVVNQEFHNIDDVVEIRKLRAALVAIRKEENERGNTGGVIWYLAADALGDLPDEPVGELSEEACADLCRRLKQLGVCGDTRRNILIREWFNEQQCTVKSSGTGCWQCEGKGCPDCLPHQPVRT